MSQDAINAAVEALQQMRQQLIGQKVMRVISGWGSSLEVSFGKSAEEKIANEEAKRGKWALWFYMCFWRVENDGQLLFGAGSDRKEMLEKMEMLIGRALTDVSFDTYNFDLVLTFDSHTTLRTFTNNPQEDQWIFYRPNDETFTAKGNGTYEVGG